MSTQQSTQQELVEQNLRLLIGDLQVQLVFAKAQIQTLEQMYQDISAKVEAQDEQGTSSTKLNGAYPSDAPPAG